MANDVFHNFIEMLCFHLLDFHASNCKSRMPPYLGFISLASQICCLWYWAKEFMHFWIVNSIEQTKCKSATEMLEHKQFEKYFASCLLAPFFSIFQWEMVSQGLRHYCFIAPFYQSLLMI